MPLHDPVAQERVNSDYDVIIVGGGPAGSSTALSLVLLNPCLVDRILLIDRSRFPRPKLCGGGITHKADAMLDWLHVDTRSLRSAPIDQIEFRMARRTIDFRTHNAFRIVSREEFDNHLLCTVRERGIAVRQEESLRTLTHDQSSVLVQTTQGRYRAQVIVGADGANSTVRRFLKKAAPSATMLALEAVLPQIPGNQGRSFRSALFDFRRASNDFWGYYWEFPSWSDVGPHISAGIIDTRRSPERAQDSLRELFLQRLQEDGITSADVEIRGHPLRWFDLHGTLCHERCILVGDAAGTDPLWADGITSALRFGWIAAKAVVKSIDAGQFSFTEYERAIRRSQLGRSLQVRKALATLFYGNKAPAYPLVADWATQRLIRLVSS